MDIRTRLYFVGTLALLLAPMPAAAQLNVLCPMAAEWCSLAATEFEKATGIKASMTLKGSGESFAQVAAEKANPKLDIWFGGTGDPHLQAAELDLTMPYKSPLLDQLQPWARKQAEQSGYKTVGLYLGVLGIGYNTELVAKKKAAAAGLLEGPRQADLRGRRADGQSQCVRHRVHGDRHAGPGVRRGRRVQAAEGHAQEHQLVFAPGRRTDQGDGARRKHGRRRVHPRRRHRSAGRIPGEERRALRRHRLRDRLDVDHQGRAQSGKRAQVLRLGADARRPGSRRASQVVPAAVERRARRSRRFRPSRPRSS